MGTWGIKLYDDDVASDVKEEYIDLLKQGKGNEEATKKLIESWDTEDMEEGPIFWFALADTQWEYGRLLEYVKNHALHYIEAGTDLERWKEDKKIYNKRKKVLEKLKEKLNSPMPKEKRIVKRRNYICPWKMGDVYAYQIKDNEEYKGKYICVIKVSEDGEYLPNNICPIVYVYNKIFYEIPRIEGMKNIQYLPQFYTPNAYKGIYRDILYRCFIMVNSRTKKSVIDFIYVGNIKDFPLPNNEQNNKYIEVKEYLCQIKEFEKCQINFLDNWKGIKY